MKGLIVAGYGGHAGYAFALAHELSKRGVELDILVPRGYEYIVEKFRSMGSIVYMTLPRRPLEPIYKGLHRWIVASAESLKLLKSKYDFVFASGSNFSILPFLATKVARGVKAYTLEAVDRVYTRSKAVSAMYRLGATVFLHWREQLKLYPKGLHVGPIYEPAVYEPRDGGYVLVTTGTLGAREVFDALVQLDLEKAVVQTGDVAVEPYARKKPNWVFFNYVEDLYKWIAGAGVVVTHPGLTAATARLAYGKPLVLVYTRRHSKLFTKEEVKTLAEKLRAVYLEEVTPDKLAAAIEEAKHLEKPDYEHGASRAAALILKDTQSRPQ